MRLQNHFLLLSSFNGYNGFLDKKRRRKKSKKKERRETIPIIDDDDNDVARHGSARLPLGALQDPERAVYCDRGLGEKGVLDACVQICSTSLSLSLSVLTFFFFHSNSFLCCFRRFFMALRWITITRNKPTGTENPQQE